MTYTELVEKLKSRYVSFRVDDRFHRIKKELEDQRKNGEKFCKFNYLDVINKSGGYRKFYSIEILKEFDKYYTKQ